MNENIILKNVVHFSKGRSLFVFVSRSLDVSVSRRIEYVPRYNNNMDENQTMHQSLSQSGTLIGERKYSTIQ